MTILSREYFNVIDQQMKNCATNANMMKRNGFYENAIELWKNYSKGNHPFQLIAIGKLYLLTGEIKSAKSSFEKCLKLFANNERLIEEPLRSNVLSSLEFLGYCIRENSDTNIFIDRISGRAKGVVMVDNRILFKSDEEADIDLKESRKRFISAIDYLKKKGIHNTSFNSVIP